MSGTVASTSSVEEGQDAVINEDLVEEEAGAAIGVHAGEKAVSGVHGEGKEAGGVRAGEEEAGDVRAGREAAGDVRASGDATGDVRAVGEAAVGVRVGGRAEGVDCAEGEAAIVSQASLLVEGEGGLETTVSGSSRYAGLLEEKIDTPATEVVPSPQVVPAGVLVNSAAENGGGGLGAQTKKGLTCPHCGALGIHGMSKLMLHVDRMHSKPYTCNICEVEFVDRYSFNLHSPTCFYMCPVEGCNFQEKRESRLKRHLRRHRVL